MAKVPAYFTSLLKAENAAVASYLLTDEANSCAPTGSVSLDWCLGGKGVPRNELIMFWGTPGSMKTTIALLLMAKELELNPDKFAIWIDTEYSWSSERAKYFGVDLERVILFQGNRFEDTFIPLSKIEDSIVKDKNICFIGLDSLKGLVSFGEDGQMEEGDIEGAANAFGGIAKSVNPAMNMLNRVAHEAKCMTIIINHAMMNLNPQTSKYYPYILTGGQKTKHLCSTIVFMDKSEAKSAKITVEDVKDINGNNLAVGALIRCKVTKTRKTVEGKCAEFSFNMVSGKFEKQGFELADLAKNLGVISDGETSGLVYKDVTAKSLAAMGDILENDKNLFEEVFQQCNKKHINPFVQINAEFAPPVDASKGKKKK